MTGQAVRLILPVLAGRAWVEGCKMQTARRPAGLTSVRPLYRPPTPGQFHRAVETTCRPFGGGFFSLRLAYYFEARCYANSLLGFEFLLPAHLECGVVPQSNLEAQRRFHRWARY